MKKGFTLIEMMGVIAVLAVILLVTFPALSKSLKNSKESTNNNFLNNLKVSAEAFIELNRDRFPELKEPYSQVEITIQQLYDANLLKGQNNEISNSDIITAVVGQDLEIKYYFKGKQIGYGAKSNTVDDDLEREFALINSKINVNVTNRIYL